MLLRKQRREDLASPACSSSVIAAVGTAKGETGREEAAC